MEKTKIIITIALIAIIAVSAIFVVYTTQNPPQQGQIIITDSEGYQTVLEAVPNRIICIAPSITPILYEIGVGDKVVGLTTYDDAPYNFTAWFEAGNMTSVGGFSTPNLEAIISLQPDIIFTTDINDAMLPNMRDLGLKVVVVGPKSVDGVFQTIKLIGKATGAESNADALVNRLTDKVNTVVATINAANITEKPTVYYEVWSSNAGYMTIGSSSWMNDVVEKAGGINLFANVTEEYPTTSLEVLVTENPDVILLPTDMGGSPSYGSVEQVKARTGFNTINAVINNRIYVLDSDLLNEPGIRVADQVEAIAACLYPNLFPSPS
ncbi:MAG: ABC transporter substrate-binding protein [Candidatus Bathyarchaeia archaeon]